MKKLILMRHAKSDWANSGGGSEDLPDIERPLNERGRRSASLIGKHLFAQNLIPGLILVSTAQRTRETVHRMAAEWPEAADAGGSKGPRIRFIDELYLASAETLFKQIRGAGQNEDLVMILAHNPGIANLARKLSTNADAMLYAQLCKKYPTGAFTVFNLDAGDWSDATKDAFQIETFLRPRDIQGI